MQAKSRASLDELLSGTEGSNDLATLAAALGLAVVDDMPASDPRWVESVGEQQPQKKLGPLFIAVRYAIASLQLYVSFFRAILNFFREANDWKLLIDPLSAN